LVFSVQLGFLHQNAFFIVKLFTSLSLSDSIQKLQQKQEDCFTVSYRRKIIKRKVFGWNGCVGKNDTHVTVTATATATGPK
jgi:hypothetical protein